MVLSTTAAGTISQTARGLVSFLANSASDAVPTAFSFASSATAFGGHVEHHAFMAALQEAAHHVRAHPAKADHSQLHANPSFLKRRRSIGPDHAVPDDGRLACLSKISTNSR